MTQQTFKDLMEPLVCNDSTGMRAWKRAWEIGMPTRKTENFKRHNLQAVFTGTQSDANPLKIRDELDSGIVCLPMQEAKLSYNVFMQNLSTKLLEKETTIFPLLNEACCNEGLFFHVTKNCEKPVWIEDLIEKESSILLRRIVIYVAKGASVDFVLNRKHLANVSSNFLIDIVLEPESTCKMIDLDVEGSDSACSMMHVRAQVKQDAIFRHYSANRGGALLRSDFRVELLGERSEVDLQGIWLLEGKRSSHIDILIEHKAPNTRSSQHYKGVLRDKSKSTFEGKIFVDPIAQKTEAYQLNNNLVLDNGACAFSKPNLEIFADDVKASHGATVTELDDEEVFYLTTRGINPLQAKLLLTKGFTDSVLKNFFNEEAKRIVNGI